MFIDPFGHAITYLRISLTDRCNLRCVYCMPKEGLQWQARADQLSVEEIVRVVETAAQGGVKRVRLTGGVSADNAAQYLKAGAVVVAVGGSLVDKKAVARSDWAAITAEAQRLVSVVQSALI